MKRYETLIIEVYTYVENNNLRKNVKLFFVQDNHELYRENTSELDVLREYNQLGWFVSAVDATNRQFIMTREIDFFNSLNFHPVTKGD